MEVRTRAPGKIIFSGEHAVVHGSTAIAASIDLYTRVALQISSDSENGEGLLKLQLKDMGLEFLWSIRRIREMLPDLSAPLPSQPMACSSESMESIAVLVEEQSIPEAKVGLASGILAFLWLYTSIQGLKPATIVVTSDLPFGAGLGSSASLCVALSGALLALSDVTNLDLSSQGWLTFGESELDLVNMWAFEAEKIIHGKPSGLDNTVSTFGNMIMFKSGKLTCIKSGMPLRMLITNTKVGRNTKALVAGVSERTSRHPDAMNAVFSAVDYISKELSTIIQSPVHDDLSVTKKEEKIEELMEMNQGLLQCMGVSHASIETVLRTTLKYKLSSKLTGAGGGGCVLTFLPALLSGTVVDKVIVELESCGFQCLIAGIGVKGLEICFGGSS
ncbi:mevalonate kinase [Macadamia integrifolia]|uniref:mevalonate kinase n=1 Tax=Macadamia integrifolia TaxID=60698 RepID=UPI001C4E7BEE|nr:mevalonate kinase [Macadamia integrifolia]XP_042504856.1 mevalonate kinase [Macadamia integrifolia]XP_042504857.1 mevalonate kinase [Macadamia integrifolia]XP_042504858.1 mevalonate kinase [Macadamia integrifolia]XP_042504859.1 mevalonate kinase [Macadamia integrifolia]